MVISSLHPQSVPQPSSLRGIHIHVYASSTSMSSHKPSKHVYFVVFISPLERAVPMFLRFYVPISTLFGNGVLCFPVVKHRTRGPKGRDPHLRVNSFPLLDSWQCRRRSCQVISLYCLSSSGPTKPTYVACDDLKSSISRTSSYDIIVMTSFLQQGAI